MSNSHVGVPYKARLALLLVLAMIVALLDSAQAAVPPAPPGGVSGTYGLDIRTPGVDGARGTMSYTYPFELPAARGDAQPTLGLTYSSERGTSDAGDGWSSSCRRSSEHRSRAGRSTPRILADPRTRIATPSQGSLSRMSAAG